MRVAANPTPWGPIRSRRRAELAARALAGATEQELGRLTSGGPLPRLRRKLADFSESLRYEDAARLRDRIAALESVVRELRTLERLRAVEACLLVPAVEEGFWRAFFVTAGRVAAVRTLPRGAGARLEVAAATSTCRRAPASLAPEDADELLLLGTFLRRPPPELRVVRFDAVAGVAA